MCVSRLVVSIACLNLLALSGLPASAQSDATVFRVQALNDSGVREGTCFVVRQEQRAEGTFLVLVTSARLFDRESRRRARVFVDPNAPVEIGPDAITTPYANRRDVAVLQATVNGPPISAL